MCSSEKKEREREKKKKPPKIETWVAVREA